MFSFFILKIPFENCEKWNQINSWFQRFISWPQVQNLALFNVIITWHFICKTNSLFTTFTPLCLFCLPNCIWCIWYEMVLLCSVIVPLYSVKSRKSYPSRCDKRYRGFTSHPSHIPSDETSIRLGSPESNIGRVQFQNVDTENGRSSTLCV